MITLHPDSLVNVWQLATAALIGAVLTIVAWPLGILWAVGTVLRQVQRRRRILAARRRRRDFLDSRGGYIVPVSTLDAMIAEREAAFRARSL